MWHPRSHLANTQWTQPRSSLDHVDFLAELHLLHAFEVTYFLSYSVFDNIFMAVMETLSARGREGDCTFKYIDFDPWPPWYVESQGSSPSPPTSPTSPDCL
ncbi:hypothetical protein M758_UG269200 [Ceratodon purpureus]|nr:hypothetical protein M758_UG269200 [Ceratodon purpureus]